HRRLSGQVLQRRPRDIVCPRPVQLPNVGDQPHRVPRLVPAHIDHPTARQRHHPAAELLLPTPKLRQPPGDLQPHLPRPASPPPPPPAHSSPPSPASRYK